MRSVTSEIRKGLLCGLDQGGLSVWGSGSRFSRNAFIATKKLDPFIEIAAIASASPRATTA